MSRFSFSHFAKLQQFIVNPQQLLEGIVVDRHAGQSTSPNDDICQRRKPSPARSTNAPSAKSTKPADFG